MKKWKSFLQKTLLFVSLLSLSGGTTYLICYSQKNRNLSNSNLDNQNKPIELTPQEKLVSSLTNIRKFDLDAIVDFTYQKTMVDGNITFTGSGDFSNLQSPMIDGSFHADFGSARVDTEIGYYDNNIYFDFNESYLYLPTNNILDFIDTLPSMGINISIPEELKNLDVNAFEEKLLAMEPVKDVQGYYFTLDLNDTISLHFKSDDEYNFTGIRTNRFYYQDLYFQLNADLKTVENTKIELVNPSTVEGAPHYTNFAPAFNLVNGMYNLFSKKQNTVGLELSLSQKDKVDPLINNHLVDLNLDLSYNLDDFSVNIKGNAKEKENTHNLDVSLLNKTLYANYNDALKFSIEGETISTVIAYVLEKIGDTRITEIFNQISQSTNDLDIIELITNFTNLNSLIKSINATENSLEVSIDPSILGIEADLLNLNFSFDKTTFLGLSIPNFNISGFNGSLKLTSKQYTPISVDVEEYAKLEYPLYTIEHIYELTQQTKFRLEFAGNVKNTVDSNLAPVTIDGGLQFDLTDNILNGYGYGELNITDRANYKHNVFVDLKDKNEVLFNYNKTMKGKFKTQTVLDLIDLVKQIVQDKDEHFMEIFGGLIQAFEESSIGQILQNKDYGKILASNVLSNLKTSIDSLQVDINGKILGLDDTFTLKVNYSYNEEVSASTIKSLQIIGLNFGNEEINFELSLLNFDDTLESTRLPLYDDYLDFSEIKTLLELGINTSKVNDWHLKSLFHINMNVPIVGDINIPVDIDIKIKNIKGKIKAIIDIPEVPLITFVNKSSTDVSRSASFYLDNGFIYGNRIDVVKKSIFNSTQLTYQKTLRTTLQGFMDNAITYLCSYALGLNDTILNLIQKSTNTGPTPENPIHYEKVLKDFNYNAVGEKFPSTSETTSPFFYLNIDLAEITKNAQLEALKIKLYHNPRPVAQSTDKFILKGINVNLLINAGLKIAVGADLELINFGDIIDISKVDEHVSAHKDDNLDEIIVTQIK